MTKAVPLLNSGSSINTRSTDEYPKAMLMLDDNFVPRMGMLAQFEPTDPQVGQMQEGMSLSWKLPDDEVR